MNKSIKPVPNLFTYKIPMIKLAVKEMQSAKFYAILLASVILVGIFSLSPAFSTLMRDVIIRSTGRIGDLATVTANSGSAEDIQAAVDQVAAMGGGNVYIPEGTFNFVEVDEGWEGTRVNIPAGVSIFGATTERDVNGQVIEWKTVLRLPWDVPGSWLGGSGDPPAQGGPQTPCWFKFLGTGEQNESSRFSDIKMVGYRSINPNSEMILRGIKVENVIDFRIDHCYFEHISGGLSAWGNNNRGVIDHCFFVNPVAHLGGSWYEQSVGYGIQVGRAKGDYWENDIDKVLGKYTNYTVFIEDCYFTNWRHCTAGCDGAHYILRYSIIEDDFGFGSIDSHGRAQMNGEITQVGTRATEIYNNTIVDAEPSVWATMMRGGAGVAFNNTVGGGSYTVFIYLSNEAPPELSKCWINDWWIWNNTMLGGCNEITEYDPEHDITEGENYFRYAPHTFTYIPYPYPHPLTLEAYP